MSDSDDSISTKPRQIKLKNEAISRKTKSSRGKKRIIESSDDEDTTTRNTKQSKQLKSKKKRESINKSAKSPSDSEDAFEPVANIKPVARAVRAVDTDTASSSLAKNAKAKAYTPLNNALIFKDIFVSQAPPQSSNPCALRGAIWLRPPSLPPRPPVPAFPKTNSLSTSTHTSRLNTNKVPVTANTSLSVIHSNKDLLENRPISGKAIENPPPQYSRISNISTTDIRKPLAPLPIARPVAKPIKPIPAGSEKVIQASGPVVDQIETATLITTTGSLCAPPVARPIARALKTSSGQAQAHIEPLAPNSEAKLQEHSSIIPPPAKQPSIHDKASHINNVRHENSCPKSTTASVVQSGSAPGQLRSSPKTTITKPVSISANSNQRGMPSGVTVVKPKALPLVRTATASSATVSIADDDDDDDDEEDEFGDMSLDILDDALVQAGGQTDTAIPRGKLPFAVNQAQGSAPQTVNKATNHGKNAGMRQMTLDGRGVGNIQRTMPKKNAQLISEKPVEPPTHHILNEDEVSTWVYPTNLGSIREYQYNIVHAGLFHNTLVALPTGLGKTFIAATIMLNWYRWTKDAQIFFLAPTKPLVAQQVDACFKTVGIPRSDTAMLTGNVNPALRGEVFEQKRVFFMTPQTLEGDIERGRCDAKRIALVVIDEAHRATGKYSYVKVISAITRYNKSFRVLALTATPGSSVDSVQEVIDGLNISKVEIRTEHSIDIQRFVFPRDIDTCTFDYSDDQQTVMDLFGKALQSTLDKLCSANASWQKDPMKITLYGLRMMQQKWALSSRSTEGGRGANPAFKGMVQSCFQVLTTLAQSIALLKFYGIRCFYSRIESWKKDIDEGNSKAKNALSIRQNDNFKKMCNFVQDKFRNPDYIGHPKLEHLRQVVLTHFLDLQESKSTTPTRVMVFTQFRDSAEEIVRVLKRNEPMIKPHIFVGQSSSRDSEGMNQKTQLDVIEKFKSGDYNTLVATSIGEEGLDIGEVDLIVCYDASTSPIRMLQRMGRTGRKRQGRIVLLLMKEKEEKDFAQAKDNYKSIQELIAKGDQFTYHDDKSPRILPKDVKPVVDKRVVEISIENSQADLPIPERKTRVKKTKAAAKKFNMPDGVVTGFVRASRVTNTGEEVEIEEDEETLHFKKSNKKSSSKSEIKKSIVKKTEPELAPIPFLNDVVLNKIQERELERKYQYVTDKDGDLVIQAPAPENNLSGFSRLDTPFYIGHGRYTRDIASTIRKMTNITDNTLVRFKNNVHLSDFEDLPDQTINIPDKMDIPLDDERIHISSPPPSTRKKKAKPETSTTNKTKPTPSTRKPTTSKHPRKKRDLLSSTHSAMEGLESSPPPTPADMRLPSQGINLGSEDTSEDETRNNNESEQDVDSDLEGFIVGSDEVIETVSSQYTNNNDGVRLEDIFTSSLPTSSTKKTSKKRRGKRKLVKGDIVSARSLMTTDVDDDESDTVVDEDMNIASRDENRGKKRKRGVVDDSSDDD